MKIFEEGGENVFRGGTGEKIRGGGAREKSWGTKALGGKRGKDVNRERGGKILAKKKGEDLRGGKGLRRKRGEMISTGNLGERS